MEKISLLKRVIHYGMEKPNLLCIAMVLCGVHFLVLAGGFLLDREDQLFLYNDTTQYVQLASHATTEGMFSLDGETESVRREPGYSTYLMMFMKLGLVQPHVITAANLWPALAVQMLLYCAACFLVARAASRIFTPFIGFLTLLFLNLYWPIFYYQYTAVSECLTYFFLTCTWMTLCRCNLRSGFTIVVGAGVLMGIACVVKSAFVPFIVVLSIFAWWRRQLTFSKALVFGLVALVLPLAWTLRNYQVTGLPILGSIDGVSSLYRGNIVPFTQIPAPEDPQMPKEAVEALSTMQGDGEKYAWYKENALLMMKGEPVRYGLQVLDRVVLMLTDFQISEKPPWYRYILLIKNDWFLVMLIFALGVPTLLRTRNFWIESSLLLCAYTVGIYSMIYGLPRYLVPALFVAAPGVAFAFAHVLILPLLRKLSLIGKSEEWRITDPALTAPSRS